MKPESYLGAERVRVCRGARIVLDGINIAFRAGELSVILGPNGAGKSTLLMCLANLLKPDAGRVTLDGELLETMPITYRAQRISFLPQLAEVAWPICVEHLVGLGRIPHQRTSTSQTNRMAVMKAMEITATSQWAQRIVDELSGGERARVLMARAFASESQWVLADESFAGLDPCHQFEAAELFQDFARQGGGVLLTVHDLSLAARIADRVVLLHDGHIIADGSPRETLTASNLRKVYGVETEWLVATNRNGAQFETPVIAIHGRHAR